MSKKDLFKNTLVLAAGKLSTQFISFILLPIYTVFLSPAEYGLVDLVIAYTGLLAPLLTLQLEMAAFRFLIDARSDEDHKIRIISNTLQIVIAVLALLIIAFVIINLFVIIPYGFLILGVGIVTILINLLLQIARGLGHNKEFALASIAIATSNLLAALGLVVFAKLGIAGVLWAVLISNLSGLIYVFFKIKIYKYFKVSAQDAKLKKELVKYSLPLVPNGVSWWVISLFDRTIIALFLGVSANGIYAISSKYATIFTSLSSIFGMSWMESASIHINDKNRNTFFSEVFNTSVRAFGSLGLILIAALPLVFWLINDQYESASLYVPLLIMGAFFNMIVSLYSAIYVARKKTKQVMTTSLIAAGINICLNFVLISFIGLFAAALSTALAYGVMAVYRHFNLKSYIQIKYDKRVIVVLTALYSLVVYLYYQDSDWVKYVNILLATAATVLLNAQLIRRLLFKNKI